MEDMEKETGLEREVLKESNYYSLENYHGIIITPENRKRLEKEYGKEAVIMAQKAERAWLRGKFVFKYKGETYPVMTTNYVNYLEQYKEALVQLTNKNEEEE